MKEYQELSVNFFTDNLSETEIKLGKLLKKVSDLVSDNDFDELAALYHYIKNIKYSGQGYLESLEDWDEEKNRILEVGYMYALIDFVQRYTEGLKTEREILKVKTKYRDSVLSILAKRKNVFHKDLATALGISASGLNAVIKQMNATSVKLINIDTISKFKLYSLTPAAYKYVVQNNINNSCKEKTRHSTNIFIMYGKQYIYKKDTAEFLFDPYVNKPIKINSVDQALDYDGWYWKEGRFNENKLGIFEDTDCGMWRRLEKQTRYIS